MNNKQREESLTLELLAAVEQRSDLTQRHLAARMGVALGLANSYLKRCARKGLIKMQQAPANRYLYYLTPQGFAEKSRLTAEYLSVSFGFYRSAADSCARAFEDCRADGVERVGLFGASDLAEVAAIKAMEAGLSVVCLCDPDGARERFLGRVPVVRSTELAPPVDAWFFTAVEEAATQHERLLVTLDGARVYAPDILRLGGPDRVQATRPQA